MGSWIVTLVLFMAAVWGEELNVVMCLEGVEDCDFVDSTAGTCAPHNGEYPPPGNQGSIMALSTLFAMFMAFGIGANDAANS